MRRQEPILVSAPGKVILFGEHAVVYGKPAVAAALSRRTYLTLSTNEDARISLRLPDLQIKRSWPLSEVVAVLGGLSITDRIKVDQAALQTIVSRLCGPTENIAVAAFFYLLSVVLQGKTTGLDVAVSSTVPVGSGLGSSAAYAVCIAAALLRVTGTLVDDLKGTVLDAGRFKGSRRPSATQLKEINEYAFLIEQLMHGTPSGIDNTVSTYGNAIYFVRGSPVRTIEKMPILNILLTNTKVPGRNTKALVAGVRERYNAPETKQKIEKALNSIEQVSKESVKLLEEMYGMKDNTPLIPKLEVLIDRNNEHLKEIGVGHEKLDEVTAISRAHGFHCKLTGAGGGGCAITLLPPRPRKKASPPPSPDATGALTTPVREKAPQKEKITSPLQVALEKCGFECYEVNVGGEGVLYHGPAYMSKLPSRNSPKRLTDDTFEEIQATPDHFLFTLPMQARALSLTFYNRPAFRSCTKATAFPSMLTFRPSVRHISGVVKPAKFKPKAVLEATPSASKRLHELMEAGGGPGKFFKLGLQKKGCNGKAFTLNVTQDAPSKFDEVVDINGMKIVIDKGALLQIIGTRMDYVTDDLMQSEFVFENPNAKGVCGCGESFN